MPTYEIQAPNGRVFEIDGPRPPTRADLQKMQVRGVFGPSGRPGYEPPPPPTARQQASDRPGQYVNEMLRNVPADLIETAKDTATGTYDLLSVLAKATGEVGVGTGNVLRETVGLTPRGGGRENIDRLASMPGALASHYAQYLNPEARAERMREHPVGTALDLIPVGGALKGGATAVRRGATLARQFPARAVDVAHGVFTGRPGAVVSGAAGYGPAQSVRDAIAAARGAAEPPPSAPPPQPVASAQAPVTPPVARPAPAARPAAAAAAQSPAPTPRSAPVQLQPKHWTPEQVQEILRLKSAGVPHDVAIERALAMPASSAAPAGTPPAPSAAPTPSAAPVSAPAQSVPRAHSPQRIQNDLGIQARRQQVTLTEPQYKAATELVSQGRTPAEAVKEVASRTATATASGTAANTSATSAPAQTKAPKASRAKLTADEADEYLRLLEKGKTHEQAVEALMAQRKLASMPGTVRPEVMRERVARRLSIDNRTASEGRPESTAPSPQNTPIAKAAPVEPVAPPVEPVKIRGYHGSPRTDLQSFNPDLAGPYGDSSVLGTFFSRDSLAAQHYKRGAGRVYGADIEGRLYTLGRDEFQALGSRADFSALRKRLTSQGFAGVDIPHMDEIAVWDPKAIKIRP